MTTLRTRQTDARKFFDTRRPFNPEIDRPRDWYAVIVVMDWTNPEKPSGSQNIVTNRALFHRLIDHLIKKGYQPL